MKFTCGNWSPKLGQFPNNITPKYYPQYDKLDLYIIALLHNLIFSTYRPLISVTISFECCERSSTVHCMKYIDWPNMSEKNGFSIAVSIKSTLKLNYQSELKEVSGVWSISEPFHILLCLKTAFQEIIIKSNGTLRNQWNILNVSFSCVQGAIYI